MPGEKRPKADGLRGHSIATEVTEQGTVLHACHPRLDGPPVSFESHPSVRPSRLMAPRTAFKTEDEMGLRGHRTNWWVERKKDRKKEGVPRKYTETGP